MAGIKQSELAIDKVMPENRTRKQHLIAIAWKRKNEGEADATKYWLLYCPRISKKAFLEC